LNILLVDDNPANLDLLRMLLEREHHVTVCATNGEEALVKAREIRPDLTISDILMPVMDGFALCKAWVKDAYLRAIPFIFYSATYQAEEDVAFGLSLGASAFLRKPMEQGAFIDRIQQVVQEVQLGVIQSAADSAPIEGEPYLKLYNERLIHKLDQRSIELTKKVIALLQSEASLRLKSAALDASIHGIVIADLDGTILWGNSALSTLTGYRLDELLGQNFRMLRSRLHDDAFYAQIWEGLRAGRAWQAEAVNQRKDGTHYTEEMTITPIVDEQGKITHITATKRDLTVMKRIEAELRHAHKMEAVGRLAGGLAHDFNNMLNIILLSAEVALLDEDLPEKHRKHLLEIQQAGRRSSDLTRQLLTFSRSQPVSQQKVDLNQLVAEHQKMMHRLVGEDFNLTFAPGPGLWSVLVDPSQVSQILANLVINARDALSHDGTIAIGTSNVNIEAVSGISQDHPAPGDYVLLVVSDTGCGMDATTLDHAFEPFFTTKAEGKGTGLGLATVLGIVNQNHGAIYARSQVGVGTVMKIYFPRFAGEGGDLLPLPAEEAVPMGSETLLLVEDERAVLEVVKTTLENRGYRVLATPAPREACRLAEQHEGPIHLLLTDVVMPSMNGRELQTQILARRPDIKTLFMSGYTGDIISTRDLLDQGTNFLQKPFRILDLAKKVREALDAKA
jgi:two-component system, cell cycle sensor histidine kinase and response regulator CckA